MLDVDTRGSLRASFGGDLAFQFSDVMLPDGHCGMVGFAPDGKVGILEVNESDSTTCVSLLFSSDPSRDTEIWSALCVAALSVALNVDLSIWLGRQLQCCGQAEAWSAERHMPGYVVSAEFHPVDIVLLSISTPPVDH